MLFRSVSKLKDLAVALAGLSTTTSRALIACIVSAVSAAVVKDISVPVPSLLATASHSLRACRKLRSESPRYMLEPRYCGHQIRRLQYMTRLVEPPGLRTKIGTMNASSPLACRKESKSELIIAGARLLQTWHTSVCGHIRHVPDTRVLLRT